MKLEIESDSLHDLLQGKKEKIGGSYISGIVNIIGGLSFGVTLHSANIENPLMNTFLAITVVVLIGIGISQVYSNIGDNKYTSTNLYEDIMNLSVSTNKYSLVAIMNTFEGYSANRVLLRYYPDKWLTFMFLSFPTAHENDEQNVKNRVAASLKVDINDITVEYLTEEPNQSKYSPDYGVNRKYDHRYYQVNIRNFPNSLMRNRFTIDNVLYKWMTLEEMKNDENIKKNNLDVLRVFEQFIFTSNAHNESLALKRSFPSNVCIRLNRICNLSCKFCLADKESPGLSTEQLKSALDKLKSNGVKRARLGGGEPTLRPDFMEIVKYCIDSGFETVIYSNLYKVDNVIDELIRLPVSFSTSIHGNEEFHDSMTTQGAYKNTCLNIEKLVSSNKPVSIHMVLMSSNYQMVEDVIKKAIELKARKFTLQTLIPRGRGADLFKTEEVSDIREKLKRLEPLKEKYGKSIKISFIDLYQKHYYVLETDGNIYLEKSNSWQDQPLDDLDQ